MREANSQHHWQSTVTRIYSQAEESHTVQTAWSCIALMCAAYPHQEPIKRGIRLIMSRQKPNGEWPQERAVGCGIMTWYGPFQSLFVPRIDANCQLVFCFIIVISTLSRLVLCRCTWRDMETMRSSKGGCYSTRQGMILRGWIYCFWWY